MKEVPGNSVTQLDTCDLSFLVPPEPFDAIY